MKESLISKIKRRYIAYPNEAKKPRNKNARDYC